MLRIEFELTGAGWIDVHLARGNVQVKLEGLSYITDVLGDMLRAALAMASGSPQALVYFELEPGQLVFKSERWFDRDEQRHGVRLTGWEASAGLKSRSPTPSDLCLDFKLDDAREFAAAILAGAKALEAKHGHDGYLKLWVLHPFPVQTTVALEAALACS